VVEVLQAAAAAAAAVLEDSQITLLLPLQLVLLAEVTVVRAE
jgi:hypothetical protein